MKTHSNKIISYKHLKSPQIKLPESYTYLKQSTNGTICRHEIDIKALLNAFDDIVEKLSISRKLSIKDLIKSLEAAGFLSKEYILIINNSLEFLNIINDTVSDKDLLDVEDIYNIQNRYKQYKPGMWTRAFIAQKYDSEDYVHEELINKLFNAVKATLNKSHIGYTAPEKMENMSTQEKAKIITEELYSRLRVIYGAVDFQASILKGNINNIAHKIEIGKKENPIKLKVTDNKYIHLQINKATISTENTFSIFKYAIENNLIISPSLLAIMKRSKNHLFLSKENIKTIKNTFVLSAEKLNFAEYARMLRDTGYLSILFKHDKAPWSAIENHIQMFALHDFPEEEHLLVTTETTQMFLKKIKNDKNKISIGEKDTTDSMVEKIQKGIEINNIETILSLLFGSLLHDIAKPISIDEKDHPFKGSKYIESLLDPLKLSPNTIRKTKQLIKYHEHFFRFWNKIDEKSPALYLMSEAIDNPYPLLLLSIADSIGLNKQIATGNIMHHFIGFTEALVNYQDNEPIKQQIAQEVISHAKWLKSKDALNNIDIDELKVRIKGFLARMDNNYLNHAGNKGAEIVLHHFLLHSKTKGERIVEMNFSPNFSLTTKDIEKAFDMGSVLPYNIVKNLIKKGLIEEDSYDKLIITQKGKDHPEKIKQIFNKFSYDEKNAELLINSGRYISDLLIKNNYLKEENGLLFASNTYLKAKPDEAIQINSFSKELDSFIEKLMNTQKNNHQPKVIIVGSNKSGLLSTISEKFMEHNLGSQQTNAFTGINKQTVIDEFIFTNEDLEKLKAMFESGKIRIKLQQSKKHFAGKTIQGKIKKIDAFRYPEETLLFIEAKHNGNNALMEQIYSLLSFYDIEVSFIKKTIENGTVKVECIIENDSLNPKHFKSEEELIDKIRSLTIDKQQKKDAP